MSFKGDSGNESGVATENECWSVSVLDVDVAKDCLAVRVFAYQQSFMASCVFNQLTHNRQRKIICFHTSGLVCAAS